MNLELMKEALEQYYEAAGFENFYERELSKMNAEQIKDLYLETFSNDSMEG